MNFQKLSLIIFAFLFSIQPNFAQGEEKKPSIEDLNFMIGMWKGEGWIQSQSGRKEFTQTESIRPKVEGKLLVVDGLGYGKGSPEEEARVIHNAYGVISFNEELQQLTMLSFATTGGKMENEMRITGEKTLEWSFKDERGGTIRFSEDFSHEGIWQEKGEYSPDGGKSWYQFFQMELKRVEE